MDEAPMVSQPASGVGETQVQVTCPHCGKGFWHKISHAFKTVGTAAIETAITIAASNTGFGGDR